MRPGPIRVALEDAEGALGRLTRSLDIEESLHRAWDFELRTKYATVEAEADFQKERADRLFEALQLALIELNDVHLGRDGVQKLAPVYRAIEDAIQKDKVLEP